MDGSGFKGTGEKIISNFTDDGKLADTRWDMRHHVTPSAFNGTNHTYSKVSSI